MQLGTIQKRILTNANILKITKSLKIMSLTRLKILTQQKKAMDHNLPKVANIYKEKIRVVKKSSFLHKKINSEVIQDNKKEVILNLFLFTDMSFCGSLNKTTEKALEPQNANSNFIVGNKGKKLEGKFLGKLYDKKILQEISNNIFNYFHSLKAISTQEQEISCQYILRIHMLGGTYDLHYHQSASGNDQDQTVFNGYFKYLLQDHLLIFKKEESHIRLMKLTSAIDNSEELANELKMYYNKTRQTLITAELLETIASSMLQ